MRFRGAWAGDWEVGSLVFLAGGHDASGGQRLIFGPELVRIGARLSLAFRNQHELSAAQWGV